MTGTHGALAERLWRRCKRMADGCLEWQGYRQRKGYGVIRSGGAKGEILLTHRAAWIVTHGPIPDGLWALHHCDNPPCCDPTHLYLGTHEDNMRDRDERDRLPRGVRHYECKLTDAQVSEVRNSWVPGKGGNTNELADRFGIAASYVPALCRGDKRVPRGQHVERVNRVVKLAPPQEAEIRERYAGGGISQGALAAEYGVSQWLIHRVVRRPLGVATIESVGG